MGNGFEIFSFFKFKFFLKDRNKKNIEKKKLFL